MNPDRVESLSAGKDANHYRIQLICGLEQKAALHRATGHLNEGSGIRNEP